MRTRSVNEETAHSSKSADPIQMCACMHLHKSWLINTNRPWLLLHGTSLIYSTTCNSLQTSDPFGCYSTSSLDTIMNSITITCHKIDWYVYPVLIPSEFISCTFSDWLVKMTNPDWLPSNLSDWNNTSCVWWWYSMASSGSLSSGGFLRNFVL